MIVYIFLKTSIAHLPYGTEQYDFHQQNNQSSLTIIVIMIKKPGIKPLLIDFSKSTVTS